MSADSPAPAPRTSTGGMWRRVSRLPSQLLRRNPFAGDCLPARVPLFSMGNRRPSLPFPHPWNYQEPLRILDSFFHGADDLPGPGRHNRYLDVPGFDPVLVTRDPGIIRAITSETGDREGQFDRDTLPSTGIARATGPDTLLFANGALWRRQRKASAAPFGKTSLFQTERFQEFEETFRDTISGRIAVLREHSAATGQTRVQLALEPEIKAVMLEILTNNFFGAQLGYTEIREIYVPAIEQVIDHIVRDTVINKIGLPVHRLPPLTRNLARTRAAYARFEELTAIVLAQRASGRGLWKQFKSDAPDQALLSNLKVFLAGALEATTSFATWALSHLSRDPAAQEKTYECVRNVERYTPESLEQASWLTHVLDETLRLTPALYFLPRRTTADTWVETADGRRMWIPAGAHILLDVWHANRHEDHWGAAVTGHRADEFAPQRWAALAESGRGSKEFLHFGFGHGPRVCPGKHLGQLEVSLVVGAFVKVFRFCAVGRASGHHG